MRSTPIGIAMLNDEREHVWRANNPENMRVVKQWAETVRRSLKNVDRTTPEIVTGSKIITGTRVAQQVGEELHRAGCRSVIMCYNVWNFPFLVWPFINSVGRDVPVLSLSNNNGKFPGNVGLLATDGALRQAGVRTHRIVGDMDDRNVQAQVADWCRAAQAVTTIRNEVYGLYGGHSMGMETGYWHLTAMLKCLGVTCRQIDQLWLVKVMEQEVDEDEVEKGLEWLTKMLGGQRPGGRSRILYDGKMLTPETLKTQLRLYCAMKLVNEMVHEHNEYIAGFESDNGIQSADPQEVVQWIAVNSDMKINLARCDKSPSLVGACEIEEDGRNITCLFFDRGEKRISLFMLHSGAGAMPEAKTMKVKDKSVYFGSCTGNNYILWSDGGVVSILVSRLPENSLIDMAENLI